MDQKKIVQYVELNPKIIILFQNFVSDSIILLDKAMGSMLWKTWPLNLRAEYVGYDLILLVLCVYVRYFILFTQPLQSTFYDREIGIYFLKVTVLKVTVVYQQNLPNLRFRLIRSLRILGAEIPHAKALFSRNYCPIRNKIKI